MSKASDDFFSFEGMKRAFELKAPPARMHVPSGPPYNGELVRDRRTQKAIDRRRVYLAKKGSRHV